MGVSLIHITPNYMDVLKHAIGMCHQTKVGDRVVKHCINAGHLSVLEHCTAVFEIKCSIQTLLQITRHRHLGFTVQSSRVCGLTEVYKTGDEWLDFEIEVAMARYNEALERGIKHEYAAYLLPKAAMYNLVVSGNFRAWYLPHPLLPIDLFQVLFLKLKAGDEWLCINTKYSLTLRLVPPPSSNNLLKW